MGYHLNILEVHVSNTRKISLQDKTTTELIVEKIRNRKKNGDGKLQFLFNKNFKDFTHPPWMKSTVKVCDIMLIMMRSVDKKFVVTSGQRRNRRW